MNTKLGLSNLKFIDEDGSEKDIASGVIECGIDITSQKDKSANGLFLVDGEVSINISNATIKKYHRKRKGKKYLVYYYEEYSLFDDFQNKVFGKKIKNKKYRKIGGKIND